MCKRTKEACDHGSEVGTVHSGRDGGGQAPMRTKEIYQKRDL